MSRVFSEVTGPKFAHFLHDIQAMSGIIYAVNVHIEVAISHSVSECQSDKCRGVGNFASKLVAMARSLEELEKLDRIEKIHADTFHLVKKS